MTVIIYAKLQVCLKKEKFSDRIYFKKWHVDKKQKKKKHVKKLSE